MMDPRLCKVQHGSFNRQIDSLSPALPLQNDHATARISCHVPPRRVGGIKCPPSNDSTPTKPKTRCLSGWAKEAVTELGPLEILKDSRVRVTRRTLKVVTELAANREPLPQKSLNLTLLAGGDATLSPGETRDDSEYEGSSQSTLSDDIELFSTPSRDLNYSPRGSQVIGSHENQVCGPLQIIPKHPNTTHFSSKGVLEAEVLAQGPLRWEEWHKQKSKSG